MKLTNLPKEGLGILLLGLLGFTLLTFLSCSTTSQLGCSELLGEERDRCMAEYRINEAQFGRREREIRYTR